MDSLLYFTIIAITLTSSLATHKIPLKCFFENGNPLNVFAASHDLASSFVSPTVKPLRFDVMRANAVSLDKDGWLQAAETVEFDGLGNSILDEFGFNFTINVVHVTFHTDLMIRHPYKTNGTLFSMPIYGEGDAKGFLKNVQFGLAIPFDIIEVNGNKFIKLRSYSFRYSVIDKAEFSFSNLYNEDKELSDSMHKLINENWKVFVTEFGKVFLEKVTDNVFDVFKKYMLDIPLKDFSNC